MSTRSWPCFIDVAHKYIILCVIFSCCVHKTRTIGLSAYNIFNYA